ncbi:MAG TPA: VOC family protein [Chthoniobacterales bacterium]|nr:VOC family protein [Chthoniobacterales bacterium]
MDPSQTKHGEFSWNELLTTDPAAATKFYTQLFGWTTQDFPMSDFTYTVVKLKGAVQGQGGVMPIASHAKGMPPAWFPWVTVDNVEATVKQAVQLGGKVLVEPKDIQEVGRFAVIQDPQGAAITIIQAPFLGLIGSPRDALGS